VTDSPLASSVAAAPEEARRPVRATLVTALVLSAAVLVTSLLGTVLLHSLQRASGFHDTPTTLRAWLSYPSTTSEGLAPGASLYFEIASPGTAPVHWRVLNDGRVIASGSVQGTSGAALQVLASTSQAAPSSWLSVSVGDLRTPLRVWVT
jgi:hypothetical protein